MGINCRILLPFLFIFYCFKVSSAQVSDVVTYTTKSVEELECRFTSSVVQWTEQLDDEGAIVLFSYIENTLPTKKTNNSKYDNFNFSLKGANRFNLLITNVDKHDGGRYQCSSFSETPVTFDVNVEVLPESITINCTELNVCTSSAERENDPQIVCNCMATGVLSSNMVEIEWNGVNSSLTNRDLDPSTGTLSISSKTTLPSLNEGSSVSCLLTGYESHIPERLRSFTYKFSPPVCTLLMQGCSPDSTSAKLICNCTDGSPEINAYTFYNSEKSAIGTQVSNEKNVQVAANTIENFYCSGCNGVMHNPKFVEHEFRCQQATTPAAMSTKATPSTIPTDPPFKWWIILIVILVIAGVGIGVTVYCCCCKESSTSSKGNNSAFSGGNTNRSFTQPAYDVVKEDAQAKSDDNTDGNGKNSDPPEYAAVYKPLKNEPTAAPRYSAPSAGEEPEKMELQYADIDHGNRGPSFEIHQPADAPTEYATVQSVIV